MASRRKSTTPCMRAPQEVVVEESDQEMQEEEEVVGEEVEELEEELGGGEGMEPDLDSAEGGFECKYCPFRTAEVKQFTQHVDQQHPQVVLNASYVCLDCDFHTKRYAQPYSAQSLHTEGYNLAPAALSPSTRRGTMGPTALSPSTLGLSLFIRYRICI